MIFFLNKHNLPYEAVWDLDVLGIKTVRISKAFNI